LIYDNFQGFYLAFIVYQFRNTDKDKAKNVQHFNERDRIYRNLLITMIAIMLLDWFAAAIDIYRTFFDMPGTPQVIFLLLSNSIFVLHSSCKCYLLHCLIRLAFTKQVIAAHAPKTVVKAMKQGSKE
jgi:hypothetical protein